MDDNIITFASNVHIHNQFYTIDSDKYYIDDYNDINNITQMDNSEDTPSQLYLHLIQSCTYCQFVCTKHICALVCEKTEDNKFLTFNAQTMVQSIKPIIGQAFETSITICVYDNKQFTDILQLFNIPFIKLLISFVITEDGNEIMRCQFTFDINQYSDLTIIIHFNVTNYKEFVTFITNCRNINTLIINDQDEPMHQGDYSKVFSNIDIIELILNTCAQNKTITNLTINWCDYLQIIRASLACFADSNIKYLQIGHSVNPLHKMTRDLIQTPSLKILDLRYFTDYTINDNMLPFCEVINNSNITKLYCLFQLYRQESFVQFCKLASFKKNFEVLTLGCN